MNTWKSGRKKKKEAIMDPEIVKLVTLSQPIKEENVLLKDELRIEQFEDFKKAFSNSSPEARKEFMAASIKNQAGSSKVGDVPLEKNLSFAILECSKTPKGMEMLNDLFDKADEHEKYYIASHFAPQSGTGFELNQKISRFQHENGIGPDGM